MKCSSTFKLILFGFICAFLASSCTKEGPMGPAGTNGADGADGIDGRDGVDGNVTCLVCHASENMDKIQGQFAMSEHSVGAIAVDYAGGRASCAPCHSHEQFVQTMTVGYVAGDITNPGAWQCSTCHGIHETFEGVDYALRSSDPVIANFNESVTMDLNGNSNLCAVCHQSRTGGPSLTNPDDPTFTITSTHWGPHHGPQANVVAGMGFEEIPGSVPYPEAGSSPHLNLASCTGCHMAEFNGGQGGHSYIPSVAACNDCHDGADLDGSYNYKATQTIVEEKLVELRDLLIDFHVVEGDEENGYHPHTGTYPKILAQAYFNWVGLEEDRSLGVHNPEYVKALLLNTLEALETSSLE
jgi:hypothetical protein